MQLLCSDSFLGSDSDSSPPKTGPSAISEQTTLHHIVASRVRIAYNLLSSPLARAMAITQAKRRARLVPTEFHSEQELPENPLVPWDAAMANRTFKAKVAEWVTEALPSHLYLPRGRKLIMDWRGETEDHWVVGVDGLCKKQHTRQQARLGDMSRTALNLWTMASASSREFKILSLVQ